MNLPKGDHVISTRTQQIWKGDDGIVRAVYIPGADPTLDDAKANIAADLRAAGTDRFVLLVDYAGLRSFRRDVRVWLAGPEVAAVIAAFGILVASPLARIIANFVTPS